MPISAVSAAQTTVFCRTLQNSHLMAIERSMGRVRSGEIPIARPIKTRSADAARQIMTILVTSQVQAEPFPRRFRVISLRNRVA
jgi:hypothetical protein